jgi:hypothetical protein
MQNVIIGEWEVMEGLSHQRRRSGMSLVIPLHFIDHIGNRGELPLAVGSRGVYQRFRIPQVDGCINIGQLGEVVALPALAG